MQAVSGRNIGESHKEGNGFSLGIELREYFYLFVTNPQLRAHPEEVTEKNAEHRRL